ncbi:MAG: gliding motility-associated C-terminal domain-containing protein, partial [Bacteroidales bacterium]|nr:gliding motility-associated C-terminal domain-containing protein [Bacteroidales bacterium]
PKVEATYTIKDIPEAPTTTPAEVCYGESNKAVTAEGEGTISWYADAMKSSILKTGNSFTSNDTEVGIYKYYAAQKVRGCEGQTAAAEYVIKSLPSAPVASMQANICSYDDAPELRVYGENITWYSSDKKTKIGEFETYQTTDMSAGIKRYYASQTVDGCEGEKTPISFTINEKPTNPEVFGASVCAGDTVIPALRTNMLMDKWYADESVVTFLGQGYNYTPAVSEIGSSDKTYYVQRELNSCVSDVVPVTLRVIQQPTFTIGEDTILCIYDSVLTIQAGDFAPAITSTSYIDWKVSNGTSFKKYMDTEDHNIQPTNMINAPGTYTVSAVYTYKYDAVTCQSEEASFTYKVIDRARTPIVFSKVICQGEDIKDLQALGSANIVWESLSGIQPAVWNGRKYKFDSGQVLDTGTYYFRLHDINLYDEENFRGCESIADTVSMTVAASAKTKMIGADSVCVGETEEYYTQYTKGSTYFWNVTGDHLNYAKTDATSVRYIDWSKPGIDTLTVYEQTWAGCEGFDTLIVKIAPVPEPMFTWSMPGSTNIIELKDSTLQDSLWFTNSEGELVGEEIPYNISWNFGHIGENESDIDLEVPYNQRNKAIREGDYIYGYNCPILTVTNSFGCKAKYKECIFVNLTSSLYVPNAFSPTNPAHSVRSFQPKGYNLKTCEISVYDKWGNLLWYSDEVEDGKFVGKWDGMYDGKMMKSDVYIWKMEATFLDGQIWEGFDNGNGKKTKFGSVTLVR